MNLQSLSSIVSPSGGEDQVSSVELPQLLAKRLSPSRERVVRFLYGILAQSRGLVFLWLGANILAGLLEGSSMSLLYLAISILIAGDQSGVSNSEWLRNFGDLLITFSDKETAFFILIGLVTIIQIFQSSMYYTGYSLAAILRVRVRRLVMNALSRQIMGLSFQEISQYKSGDLWTYISFGKTFEKLIGHVNQGVYTLVMALAYLFVLLWLSWSMTLTALVILGTVYVLMKTLMQKMYEFSHKNLMAEKLLNEHIQNIFFGMRIIRSFGAERKASALVEGSVDESSKHNLYATLCEGLISPTVDIVTFITLAGALVGINLFLGDQIENLLPTTLLFILVLARLMPRMGNINNVRGRIYNAWPVVSHIVEFLRDDNKVMARKGGVHFAELKKGITFKNVTMRYLKGDHPAVENLNFLIPSRGTLAFIGESGAGKSTVLDMILGLFEPTSGQILVDDIPLNQIEIESWLNRIGVVSQDTFLFPATIRENLIFGKPDATEDEIIGATKVAHAHEFISRFPDGYDTVIGERGFRLSGGQQQRLALARAILRDPEILILDEATSDLDTHSERLIRDALDDFGRKKTVIMVAHRLSTVSMADEILVMHHGKIVEQGNHKELITMDGIYHSLWNLQSDNQASE